MCVYIYIYIYIIYTRARVGIEKLRRPLAGPHTPLLRSEERIALGPDDRNSREEWIVLQKQTTRLRALAVWRQAFPCRREEERERVLFDLPVLANVSFIPAGTLAVRHTSLEPRQQYFVT